MPIESWLTAALLTVAVWGLATLTSKPATVQLGARRMVTMVFLGEAAVYFALFLLLGTDVILEGAPVPVAAGLFAGAAGALAYLFYYEGMRSGTVGLIGTVSAAYPVVTILLSLLVLGETLGAAQALGIALVLLCVGILAWAPRGVPTSPQRAVGFALLAFLGWGLWGFLTKVSVDAIGEGNVFGMYSVANLALLTAYVPLSRGRTADPHGPTKRSWALGLVTVGLGAAGAISLTVAYALGPASLISPISGSYPVIATIAARFVLREAFGWRQAAALALFIVGILLIAI